MHYLRTRAGRPILPGVPVRVLTICCDPHIGDAVDFISVSTEVVRRLRVLALRVTRLGPDARAKTRYRCA